jgi:hypothetical protein
MVTDVENHGGFNSKLILSSEFPLSEKRGSPFDFTRGFQLGAETSRSPAAVFWGAETGGP